MELFSNWWCEWRFQLNFSQLEKEFHRRIEISLQKLNLSNIFFIDIEKHFPSNMSADCVISVRLTVAFLIKSSSNLGGAHRKPALHKFKWMLKRSDHTESYEIHPHNQKNSKLNWKFPANGKERESENARKTKKAKREIHCKIDYSFAFNSKVNLRRRLCTRLRERESKRESKREGRVELGVELNCEGSRECRKEGICVDM